MNRKSTLATVLCFVLLIANQGLARSVETEEAPLEPVPRSLLDTVGNLLGATAGAAAGSTGGCTGGGGGTGGGVLGMLGLGSVTSMLCGIVGGLTGLLGYIPLVGPVLKSVIGLIAGLLLGCQSSAGSPITNGLLSVLQG